MAGCKLTLVTGDPSCRFSGKTGDIVNLTVVGTVGSAVIHSASYAGRDLITAPSPNISFTVEAGSKNLSVLYTFSDPNGKAELHEQCDSDRILDDSVSSLNNAKLYHVCGSGGPAAIAVPRKSTAAAKKTAARKKRPQ